MMLKEMNPILSIVCECPLTLRGRANIIFCIMGPGASPNTLKLVLRVALDGLLP